MPKSLDRRSFLRFAGSTALGAAALPLVSPAIGLASMGKGQNAAQETRMMMGT
ncbi:MAG: twin-arginine translocation signal domain-containing protein, partial [Proteobacteria bacterium]|nr:twin-arginine translocation signal domain-containing protein [Pseudomonadota bacterium]